MRLVPMIQISCNEFIFQQRNKTTFIATSLQYLLESFKKCNSKSVAYISCCGLDHTRVGGVIQKGQSCRAPDIRGARDALKVNERFNTS